MQHFATLLRQPSHGTTRRRQGCSDWDILPFLMAVVFESKGPTVRDQLFKEYKAQRPPAPDDLKAQIPYIFRLCQGMRLAVLQQEGYEADDVIGTLARRAAAADLEVVIVTSDKDMLQLGQTKSEPLVRVFSPTKEKFFDEAEVENYFGVPPEKVVDLVALMGDAIDNIPGAKGIGEKGPRVPVPTYAKYEPATTRSSVVKKDNSLEALQTQQ